MSFQPNNVEGSATRPLADSLYQPQFRKIVWTIRPWEAFSSSVGGVNGAYGGRVVWPESGTINALGVFVVVASGNIDLGIYDTSATTRNRIASTGTTAAAGTNAYQTIAISQTVTAGDAADLWIGMDNATVKIGGQTSSLNAAQFVLPSGWMAVPLGGAPRIAGWVASGMFPLPSTFLESSFAGNSFTPFIMARYA